MTIHCGPACSQVLPVKPQGVWARGVEAWARSRDLRIWDSEVGVFRALQPNVSYDTHDDIDLVMILNWKSSWITWTVMKIFPLWFWSEFQTPELYDTHYMSNISTPWYLIILISLKILPIFLFYVIKLISVLIISLWQVILSFYLLFDYVVFCEIPFAQVLLNFKLFHYQEIRHNKKNYQQNS